MTCFLTTRCNRAGAVAAKKLAKILGTTVGYLLGENDEADLFKDPKMLQRFQDIQVLPEKKKNVF
ncbi:MAG: Helix-turn-helix family [Prolixibacteraceae bacterium]|nr:MAG: Helix-turn-helix family [Prolixibacteraceae bacterium]